MNNIHWLEQQDYDKAEGQLRGALRDIMDCFNMHGFHLLVPGAIEEIVEVAVDFSKRVRGLDHPIELKNRRNPRGKG